jgi:hypothetical protein
MTPLPFRLITRAVTRAHLPLAGCVTSLVLLCAVAHGQQKSASAIHFSPRPIAFSLDSSESPQRHAPETMAGGVAVFDYDHDGRPDIFFTNGANIDTLHKDSPKYWNRLFHNNGDGTFTDVTEKAGLKGTGFDVGVAIGDYDNDGYDDIFVAGVYRNTLYHNNGDGTFTDVTEKAGLNHPDKQYGPLWSVGAAWVDLNNDGLLDLFVVNYLSWDGKKEPDCKYNGKPEYCHPKFYKATPSQLFLNNGNGTFTDISEQAGIRAHPGSSSPTTSSSTFSITTRGTIILRKSASILEWLCRRMGTSSRVWEATSAI